MLGVYPRGTRSKNSLEMVLMWAFQMEFTDADHDWHVENCWFVVQTGLKVRLGKRKA